jgi:hypothetical protein
LVRTFAALTAVLLAGCALAGPSARAEGATLLVNNQAVATFKAASGSYGPEKRAEIAAAAVNASTELEVALEKDGPSSLVMLGDTKILTVTKSDASAHGSTVDALARTIAGRLRTVVESIGFVLPQHAAWIPIGGKATIELGGQHADKVVVTHMDGAPASGSQKGGKIFLTGNYVGQCSMTVRYGAQEETLVVHVLEYAGKVGTPAVAAVTGRPADKETVAVAASRAVLSAVTSYGDASVTVEAVNVPQLVPDQKGTAVMRVKIRGTDLYPVEQEVSVELRNVGMLEKQVEELWYSNHPESVRMPGRLYWGRLAEGKAARVLYHHMNAAQRPMMLRYMLVNSTDAPAKVALTFGDAEPHVNPTLAGYRAGQEFFPRWVRESASVIEVPPHSVVPIVYERFAPQQTASGLLALHSIEGSVLMIGDCDWGPSEVGTKGNFAHSMPAVSLADMQLNLAGQSQHVYSPAFKNLSTDYEVGGRFGYLRIGEQPVGRVDDNGKLSGNFGIVYLIEAKVSNPTSEATEIEFVFESSAGYTGAFFRINGLVYSTPLLQPKTTHRVLKVTMQPGESKTYYIETMPMSGGSYPVTVTIKPVGVN